jgi:hypothetical protein
MMDYIINRNLINKKHISIICLFVFFSCDVKKENIKNTTISFEISQYDFGEILPDKSVSVIFSFSNTGENPLLIQDVKTSCGCTVPIWEKGIIQPNEIGELKVDFDAKMIGRFNKTITVFYNGYDSPKRLFIKGEVDYLSLLK